MTWERYTDKITSFEARSYVRRAFYVRSFCDDPTGTTYLSKAPVCKLAIDPTTQFINTKSSATQPGVWFVTLEKIAAGKAAMERVPAIIHMPAQENPHSVPYHAILGHSYLSRFKVTINYRAKVLLLELNDSSPP